MASVNVPATADLAAIAGIAGNDDPAARTYEPLGEGVGTLTVEGVEQDALDAALEEIGTGAPAPPRFVPLPLLRRRLEAADQWDAVAEILMRHPAAMLRVLSLEQGVDPTNAEARMLLAAAGADPDTILAEDD